MRILALFSATVLLAATSAPVDQYFGKLKMSALRIRYEVVSIRDRYETHKILPEDALHLALLTEDAFDDWARKYPNDSWLASTGYMFAKVYAEMPGAIARGHAVTLYTFVKSRFPTTRYANESRDALHRGVPVRPDPAWAAQRRAASPAPSPSPSPSPSSSGAASAAPSPAVSPAPSPTRRGPWIRP
ncbi:MAG TPA: hypothetical protein VGG89_00430 [Candidatus Baltobacteraceae bacterium]|jgi:hypothetical protein